MKYTTLLLSGVPQKVNLFDLSYCLNRLFYTDDEIGSFTIRDLPNDGKKRQIALDFRSGFDAIAAQARLDSYHYKLPDGGEYTLCAKITWKEEFMRQQTSSPEPWREEGSEMEPEEVPWLRISLVPTVSEGAMYQANAKLDAQLELLKKQKLILRTERKILKHKKKLKNEYASMCDSESEDQPTTSKRRRKSRTPATPGPQDVQISSSGDPIPKLKALMSVESTNLKQKKSPQKESRSRSKDRSPECRDKHVNDQRSKWDAFDIHPMDRISMSKRSVIDYRSKSPERSPRRRRSGRRVRKYTRCSGSQISGFSKSHHRSNIKVLERETRSTRSRSRERSASHRSRSRERPASHKSRTRERPASRRSRTRERPASRRSRTRERPASRRSRSRERPARRRSLSRERPASRRLRSRERPASHRSRSRESSASHRSRSRERPASHRSRSRERSADSRSRSRERPASHKSRTRERPASRRSRSQERPASRRSRSRERPASHRSRSRESSASHRSRSRERPASHRSRSRERPTSHRSRSREKPASSRSRSRERPASQRSRSRERPASHRSRSRERPPSHTSRPRERSFSYRSKSRERDSTREKDRPLNVPKSPEIIRSPRCNGRIFEKPADIKENQELKTAERGDCAAATGLVSSSLPHLPVKPENHNDPSGEVMDNIEKSTISEGTGGCSDPALSTISQFTEFMENHHDDQICHKNETKECPEKNPVPEKINEQNINNLAITEVIDVDNEDSQTKTASTNLTITQETDIKAEADNKDIIIKDETKPFQAKSKRVTKSALMDITFDEDLCPIPAEPQFVLVLKKLLKQMKNTIKTADKKGFREFPMNMFKCALRSMLRNLVAGKNYLNTREIVELFRAKYPKEEDYVLVNQVIEDIKYGKYTEAGQPEDTDDDNDGVILIENKCDVVIVLDSDDDVDQIKSDQISEKPNLHDVEQIMRELRKNLQHVKAEPTLQSQDQCNIVKAEPKDYPTKVVKETSQINKVISVITSNDKTPEAQVTGTNVSAAYLPINMNREKANQTNSSAFGDCKEEPIQNIKQEKEPEFTDAAVENLLDSLIDFDNLNDVNDTEKETPQVTAITIMTSFTELISLKNEINQSTDKGGYVSTDIEANEIENDLISNKLIKSECVPGNKQYGREISPNEGRDNVRKGANDVRNKNDCNKVIHDREVGKPHQSGPSVVDGYVPCNKNAKTVSRGYEEESIESIIQYLDSICN